jgi:hypothetical protein
MISKSTIVALSQLIRTGEAEAASLAAIPEGQSLGLWASPAGGSRAVATPALVELLSRLPDEPEVLIGLASCEPKLRTAWQSIIAARLHEMGQRRDAEFLCAAITELDRAAEAVRKLLPQAKLAPTGFAELENLLFSCPAEQGPAFPKLLRAIGRTSPYVEGRAAPPVQPLPDINPLTPEINWVPNRLLRPPAETDSFSDGPTSVLTGSLSDPLGRESDTTDTPGTARLRWVLHRPWALLLAQVVFTQEAWAAEQNAGSLGLELPDDQENRFDAPARVSVVVTRPTGEEIDCGPLGELIQRVLRQLGVTLLLREDRVKDLDAQLAAVVRKLLHRQVWKFEGRGVKGRRSCYRIHEGFSVNCYRIFGAKYFNRGSSRITAAIRATADQWAAEHKQGCPTK